MPDLFDYQEPECPGLDVCPVRMCGCRFLATGHPFPDEKPPLQEHEHEARIQAFSIPR